MRITEGVGTKINSRNLKRKWDIDTADKRHIGSRCDFVTPASRNNETPRTLIDNWCHPRRTTDRKRTRSTVLMLLPVNEMVVRQRSAQDP